MPVLSEEPALRFWLRYAEREGALVEAGGDQALLLLPQSLQKAAELPEEVSVTSDPDVARDDGAVLLIAGHPAIDRAAAAVLAEGDTGRAYLPWPGSRPPTRSALETRARELVPVAHGRIDAAGEPVAAYLPLLRVGVMINYAASLTLRFQEQEEAWVDAQTGLAPSERLLAALRGAPRLARPDARQRTLPADLPLSLPAAHAQLEQRAIARQASLAVHARRALASELARADAYYRGALESIERRRANAAAERARMLEAQADATLAERARRQREIREEFRTSHEIKPVRLHLVHVPAFVLPVHVRRGSRTFRFALTWMPRVDELAAVRCPACGAPEALVAARDRLGCESCIPSAAASRAASGAPVPAAAGATAGRSGEKTVASGSGRASSPGEKATRRDDSGAHPGGRRGIPPRTRARSSASSPPSARRSAERTGNKLALTFWQRVAAGDRWPRQKTARDSPLRALHRLYGDAGPLCALGIPPHQVPTEMTASTYPTPPGAPEITLGSVIAHGDVYRYSLSWWIEAGKPVLGEVMPAPDPLSLPPARGETAGTAARLHERAPAPTAELDPVSAALWRAELGQSGLPFAVRCLTTWWRMQGDTEPGERSGPIAAAVAGAVARAAGLRRTRAQAAAIYDTELASVERATRELKAGLRLDRARGW